MFTKLLLPLTALACFAAPMAAAQGDHNGGKRQAIKERFDTNSDGVLDEAERAAVREAIGDKRARCNNNGRPHQGHHAELRERLLENFDANGDGALDEGERQAARAAHEERRAERAAQMQENNPELFARIDQDGDGQLNHQEIRRARHLHQRRQENGDRGRGRQAD